MSSTRHPTSFQKQNHASKSCQPQFCQKLTRKPPPTSNTTTNGSFSNLITQTSANENTIVQAPLMFVRGGVVYPGSHLDFAGVSGTYWSSVGRSSSNAYYLDFNSGAVYPSVNLDRYYGLSVRCVALGG